jgi:hypothetical protein
MIAIFELVGSLVGLAVATLDILFTWTGRTLARRAKPVGESTGQAERRH